jgi:hypothetical protein
MRISPVTNSIDKEATPGRMKISGCLCPEDIIGIITMSKKCYKEMTKDVKWHNRIIGRFDNMGVYLGVSLKIEYLKV